VPNIPFPSNENSLRTLTKNTETSIEPPWTRTRQSDPPVIHFVIQFKDGSDVSFAYSDLRKTKMRDAGYIELFLLGAEEEHVLIEGRHLGELIQLIRMGRIATFSELGPRTFNRAESAPSIDAIKISTIVRVKA